MLTTNPTAKATCDLAPAAAETSSTGTTAATGTSTTPTAAAGTSTTGTTAATGTSTTATAAAGTSTTGTTAATGTSTTAETSTTPTATAETSTTPTATAETSTTATTDAADAGSVTRQGLRWPSPRLMSKVIWAGLMMWWVLGGAMLQWPAMVIVGVVTALLFVPKAGPMAYVRIVRDWFGVTAWILAYGASRGAADTLGMPVQERIWIDMDLILGFGELPTHRLQRLIDWDAPARLWEVSLSLMYVSHFVVGFAVLIIMYHRDRLVWGRWWRRIVLMGSIGLAGYVLLPSAPPWMSSESGNIAMVYEGLPRGWDAVKVDWVHRLFTFGRNHANPIAAMPSLHAAWPAMLYLFWAPRHGRLMRWVLASYALYMGFTIVITGQHWLIDVFAGWLVAYVAHRIMLRLEAWNEQRKQGQPAVDSPVLAGSPAPA